ncbi:MAG TPA: GH32 C-terminal domain-containing protein [Candidatus Hydrogenedentes bacterium]|nr:GH32 C-terminal domain-containing protein [Candidatus Hydrogenedentota bacterium]
MWEIPVGLHVLVAALALAGLAGALGGDAAEAAEQDETPLVDKTLVVWVAPADLSQRGGTALTIDNLDGSFDGIIFGEISPKRWMAGSNFYLRTQREQGTYPEETADANTLVQMAIVYRGKEITILRNGEPYAQYTMPDQPQAFGPNTAVMFGKRHLDARDTAHFAGSIEDARIYNRPLDAAALASLEPDVASGPEPWAWWTFENGQLADRTGRYPEVFLTGGAALLRGRLVLDGMTGTMLAAKDRGPIDAFSVMANAPYVEDRVSAARQLRLQLLADPHRATYHFVAPEGICMPFDPNGALFWKGRYHLFYIYQDAGQHYWGHASSADLLHWRHHPPALGPGAGDEGIFSGGAFIDKDGRAIITYWGLGGGKRGICIATSNDELLEHWTKLPENPVIAESDWGYAIHNEGTPQEVICGAADPSAVWLKDGRYYLMTGNLLVLNKFGKERQRPEFLGDTTFLFASDDLLTWQYLHPFYTSKREWTRADEDNMCPDFFPLGARHMLLFISHNLGCQYYLGQYRDDRFYPETHGRMTWVDNAFFAPESVQDAQGRRIMWAWIFDQRDQDVRNASGWSGTMSLPRVLWLGDDKTLRMKPAEELERLRLNPRRQTGVQVAADTEVPLEGIQGGCLELALEIVPGGATQFGVKVRRSPGGEEQTLVYYDAADQALKIDTTHASLGQGPKVVEAGPLAMKPDEPVKLRVFLDKSVVETFANDRQGVMRRIYPTREDSVGVALFATGGPATFTTITAWDMMPANPY